jgi:hypothetical protein
MVINQLKYSMMKNIILLITIIFLTSKGSAQSIDNTQAIDKLLKPQSLSLDSTQFYQIVRKQFSAIINSSGKNTIGNYASADIKNGQLAFNATKTFKNSNMLSVNANGGVTDGFFAIFNQTKINSNIGIDIKYNMLIKPMSLSFNAKTEIHRLQNRLDSIETLNKYNNIIYQHYVESLHKKLELLNSEINMLTSQPTQQLSERESATMGYQLAIKNLEADSLRLKLHTLKPVTDVCKGNKGQAYLDKKEAVDEFKYTGICFQWISIGAGIQNNSFNQYDPNQPNLASQLSSQNYTTWNIVAEWNRFKWSQYSNFSYYILVGGRFSVEDNFSDLTKVELNDTNQNSDMVTQRTVTKKVTAFRGDYQTNLIGGKLYIDFYKFLWGNDAALHIYPEVNFKQDRSPLYNAGIGLVYSFKDAADKGGKAKINSELYFRLSDLSNIANSNLSFLGRNELGLRVSIPVSIFNF